MYTHYFRKIRFLTCLIVSEYEINYAEMRKVIIITAFLGYPLWFAMKTNYVFL